MKFVKAFFAASLFVLGFGIFCSAGIAAVGQTYYGDGATINAQGTWSYLGIAWDGECLNCHSGNWNPKAADKTSYLMTGHKNAMRKATINIPIAGPDGLIYDTDSSGHAILWNTLGTIVLGTPTTYPPLLDGACSSPGYPDASSCTAANGTWTAGSKSLFYIYGGWMSAATGSYNEPGTSIRTPGSVVNGGSFSCARCHATGMTMDLGSTASGTRPPEATYRGITTNATGSVNFDPDGEGPATFSSWASNATTSKTLEGVQCDRCHDATNHVGGVGPATVRTGADATALCLECHRQEHIVAPTRSDLGSNIHPTPFADNGPLYASEPTYTLPSIEVGNDAGYAPQFYGYSTGMEFLNSVHAKFTGSFQQINNVANYQSVFASNGTPAGGGCTTCHDVHQSTVKAVNATAPFTRDCADCHVGFIQDGTALVIHPKGPKTPLEDVTNPSTACHICHMPKPNDGIGRAAHIWRINSDATYTTFPSQSQWDAGQKTANTAPSGSYEKAVWIDIDLACGQCHDSAYGDAQGIDHFTKQQLAPVAQAMHSGSLPENSCLLCHSSQQGTYDAVQPGKNHHSGPCGECHGTSSWPLHQKIAAPGCLSCHASDQTASADGALLPAIVPGTNGNLSGKNHHGMVPGETAECTECHSAHGGVAASYSGHSYTDNTMCLGCHTEAVYGTGIPFVQGTNHHTGQCISCHDPANPLNSAKVTGPGVLPVAGTCTGCHTTFSLNSMNHPVDVTTPKTCETCHAYSKVLSGQTTSTYYSFPGVKPTDSDHVCGQCHGGSAGPSGTQYGAPYIDAPNLSGYAYNIHNAVPTVRFTWSNDPSLDYNVLFNGSATTCPAGPCTYSWTFGDGATGSGITTAHLYSASIASATATLTVSTSAGSSGSYSLTVTPKYVSSSPTAVTASAMTSGLLTTVTYTVTGGVPPYSIKIMWGDGTTTGSTAANATVNHTYPAAGAYGGTVYAIDSGVNGGQKTSATAYFSATTTLASVSGKVTRLDGVTPISGAYVYLMLGTQTKKITVTPADGTFSFANLAPGTYTLKAVRSGYVFPTAPTVIVGAENVTGVIIRASQ